MRNGWDVIGANYIISGAFGVFLKDVVIKSGGYGPTIANDMEIIMRLNRILRATKTPYEVVYLPDPVSWTEAPSTWKELADQRMRWHRGLLECLWFHKSMMFNPKYGIQGLLVHPFLLLFEAIEPLVEILGYIYIIVGWIFGIVNPLFVILFLAITIGLVFIQTLFSLIIEEFSFRRYPSFRTVSLLFAYSLIENFGYRQMTLIWRARGFISFFKRYRQIKADSKRLNSTIAKIEKSW
jgi:cellulose synthase/poly-beta-1,6-N-acetylglucosamine synthase-like glycosyltransferase